MFNPQAPPPPPILTKEQLPMPMAGIKHKINKDQYLCFCNIFN